MSEIKTYYLEMCSPELLSDKEASGEIYICEAQVKQFQFNKFLYQLVGDEWQWNDKLSWSSSQWQAYAEDESLRTWVAYVEGSPAGYYELQKQSGGNVEIAYFGLAKKFIGKGLGGYLLSHAITSAWEWSGTQRVWVHTCSLDHPSALRNYKARGMKVYQIESKTISE